MPVDVAFITQAPGHHLLYFKLANLISIFQVCIFIFQPKVYFKHQSFLENAKKSKDRKSKNHLSYEQTKYDVAVSCTFKVLVV